MSIKNFFILIIIFSVIFSINVIAATEDIGIVDDLVEDSLNNPIDENSLELSEKDDSFSESFLDLNSNDNNLHVESKSEKTFSSSKDYEIYVGKNNSEFGDGSPENPYASFDLASNQISNADNVLINVQEGTYYLGSGLLFDANNVHIKGISDNVVIKYKESSNPQFFTLSSSNGNFSMSNIFVDVSANPEVNEGGMMNFNMFKGNANLVTFNNCTFLDFCELLYWEFGEEGPVYTEPYLFKNCKFIYENAIGTTDYMDGLVFRDVTFENCIFNFKNDFNTGLFSLGMSGTAFGYKTIMKDCWFGKNSLPRCFYSDVQLADYDINRYAIFTISENYLGNDSFEIIGKLTWNDGTTDGFENFNPMILTLSSNDGGLNQTTTILKNGTFKVGYKSFSTNNKITAKLDYESQSLEFRNIDIILNAPCIDYGTDQNITVTFLNEYNGIIYVTVNGKSYNRTVDFPNLVTTINIEDSLPIGTYDVNVTFVDTEDNKTCHIYGFNTTTIIVSKFSDYDFNATITPSTVYIGDNATVTLVLPEGATGNVTIKVGENKAIEFNITDSININGFVAGDNIVNITYNGNGKYGSQSVLKHVFVSYKPTKITTINVNTNYNVAKDLVITLTDVNGKGLVDKTINVVVGTINQNLTTNATGQASINIATLVPNTYVANIAFAGDELYANSNATANVVVNKVASSLSASTVTATYNVAKDLVITLTANGKPLECQKVTVKVGTISKILTTDAKGQVSVDVSTLTPKTYAATFTYTGDTINAGSTSTAKVVVNKATLKLTAKKATFKAKKKTKKYSVVLKDNKGKAIKKAKVTLKVKDKTYKATTNAKGKATFKITKLTKKGKATATIKFGGNALYKVVTKKVKFTVKK